MPLDEEIERSAKGLVLRTTRVAEMLGYSDQAVRRMCEAGRFPGAYRAGPSGHWRIPESAVEAFKEASRPKRRVRAR